MSQSGSGWVMDVAPMEPIAGLLKELSGGRYVGVDLDPTADRRKVQVTADVSALPFASGSIKWILCSHVLEHVVDDRKAMAELARVLSSDGLALVQVPWRPTLETDEDPAAPVAERIRRFGQGDHVRYYGRDFEERLGAAGLLPVRLTPADVLEDGLILRAGLVADESVWLLARNGSRAVGSKRELIGLVSRRLPTVLVANWSEAASEVASTRRLLAEVGAESTAEIRRARVELEEAEGRAAEWERAYIWLRSRWPVRIMASGVGMWRKTVGLISRR